MTATPFETSVPDRFDYLDRVAGTDAGRSYKERMLRLLDVRPGQTVVDLGCGPGTDLPALADLATEAGRVIGVDLDQAALDRAAARLADRPGVGLGLADLHRLPLGGATVDRARTDRVLQHVADPARALAEIRRILRPGGRLVMGEPDWETLAVDHPRPEISRAYTRFICDHIVRNAAVGRQLARLAVGAGLEVPDVIPVTTVLRDVRAADRILGLERNARRAVTAGRLDPAAAEEWLDHLAHGPFLAAFTLYIVVAQAPS